LVPPNGPPLAVRAAKRALHQPYTGAIEAALEIENDAMLRALSTKDFAEAGMARKEKRAPRFKGD
jgi:enoyl-CoA hydratase/carnithine racemase